jgi:DNA-binding LacI/PurR family transcriptional regulator
VTADRLAIGFIHRLREHSICIPEDIAVVGYDDIRYSEFLEVPLTTVALPKYEMGQKATQILFELIESGETQAKKQQVLLEPKLIIRQSCGADIATGLSSNHTTPLTQRKSYWSSEY